MPLLRLNMNKLIKVGILFFVSSCSYFTSDNDIDEIKVKKSVCDFVKLSNLSCDGLDTLTIKRSHDFKYTDTNGDGSLDRVDLEGFVCDAIIYSQQNNETYVRLKLDANYEVIWYYFDSLNTGDPIIMKPASLIQLE